MTASRPRIAVLIEDHFDVAEYRQFKQYLPTRGFDVEFITNLWGNPSLRFTSNPNEGKIEEAVEVSIDITDRSAGDYAGVLLIGGYAMDRLRYQAEINPGAPNRASAVEFIRQSLATPGLKIGTICHSLWLLCADRTLIEGRRVTCAHNIVCDVENAGGIVVYEGNQTADFVVDGDLVSGKHPAMVDKFTALFADEVEKQLAVAV